MCVVRVGRRQRLGQRQPVGLYEKMMLTARLRSVRRICAREGPDFEARTADESMEAREKSTLPRRPNSASSRWLQFLSHARPSPLLQPTPSRHPRNAELFGQQHLARDAASEYEEDGLQGGSVIRLGLPTFFFGLGGGSSGATRCQKASGTNSRAMPYKMSTRESGGQLSPYFC